MNTSKEIKKLIKMTGLYRIISKYPIDKPNCACQEHIVSDKKVARPSIYLTCPRDKKGMTRYLVTCGKCGEKIALVWSKDKSLTDWCDLHYISEARMVKKESLWFGCVAVNISPVDLTLGFECSCGNDSRDFRANQTLPREKLLKKIAETETNREFNKKDSKFKVRKFKEGDLKCQQI